MSRGGAPLRVGLFGGFGTGNSGNDATLAVLVEHLRDSRPHDDLVVLSYGLPTSAWTSPPGTRTRWLARPRSEQARGPVGRRIMRVVSALRDLWQRARVMREVDVLVVAGGGLFENDATASLGNVSGLLSMLVLALSARLRGVRFVVLAVGTTAWTEPVSRTIVAWTMRLAHYRSFRDMPSRTAMITTGGAKAKDPVHADVVLARGPLPAPAGRTGLGLGVMGFSWLGDAAETRRSPYVAAYAGVARAALGRGTPVRILVGDNADGAVAAALRDEVTDKLAGGPGGPGRAGDEDARLDLVAPDDLPTVAATCEVVVCSRYHNAIAALRNGTPVIAVADRVKVRSLLESAGLGEMVLEARSVTAAQIADRLQIIEAEGEAFGRRLEVAVERLRHAAMTQLEELDRLLDHAARRQHTGRRG